MPLGGLWNLDEVPVLRVDTFEWALFSELLSNAVFDSSMDAWVSMPE